jgi:hypothetical protein
MSLRAIVPEAISGIAEHCQREGPLRILQGPELT